MDLDDLLFRYFGTSEISQVPPQAHAAGVERIAVTETHMPHPVRNMPPIRLDG